MALAEDEAIPVGVLGILGVDTHLSVQNRARHQLCGGQGAAGVAAAGVGRHVDDVTAHLCAELLESSAVFMGNLHLIIFLLAYSIWTVKSMNLREKSGGSLVYLALGLHP